MPSLKADFDELIRRVEAAASSPTRASSQSSTWSSTRSELLEVKRLMPAWTSKLANAGWQVETFSIAEHVARNIYGAPLRKVWIEADRKAPCFWERTNPALANALTAQGRLQARLEARLAALEGKTSTIVLVTDLEALHPYLADRRDRGPAPGQVPCADGLPLPRHPDREDAAEDSSASTRKTATTAPSTSAAEPRNRIRNAP